MPADFAVFLEPRFGSPHKNTAKRIELVNAILEPFNPIGLPHHFALECRDLILPAAKTLKVCRDSKRVWLYPIHVGIHLSPLISFLPF